MSNEGDGMEYDPELDGIEVGRVFRGEWLVIGKLGEGAFGEVWRVESKEFKHRAMKIVKTKESHNEIWALKKLVKSRYVPTIHAQWQFGNQTALVITLAAGDLTTLRNNIPEDQKIFSKETSMTICYHEFIHGKDVLHRDIKEPNVCVKLDASLQPLPILLLDYGVSESTKEREPVKLEETLGSSECCSPLMATGACATKSCDLRMMLYAVMVGRNFNVISEQNGKSAKELKEELEIKPENIIRLCEKKMAL
ncbi:unnamed protein product [Caenorhabditis brenneri]